MNFIKVLLIVATAFPLQSLAASIQKNDLYGQWRCNYIFGSQIQNLKANITYNININKNGTNQGKGTILFSLIGLPELKYQETDTGTWALQENELKVVSTSLQFKNISHPELDQFLNLQNNLPRKINEILDIVKLTKETMTVQSKRHNKTYTCKKAS